MRKFLAGLVAAAALFVAQPAQAYLHVADAQQTCFALGVFADSSFRGMGYNGLWHNYAAPGGGSVSSNPRSYERIADDQVWVECAFDSYNGGSNVNIYRLEVITKVIGSDASNGNVFGDGWPIWAYGGVDAYPYGEWHITTWGT